MTEDMELALRGELAELRQEHRDLDAAIAAMTEVGKADIIQLQRLKKKKLKIRDRISAIEDKLLPDISA